MVSQCSKLPSVGLVGVGAFGYMFARHLAAHLPLCAFDPVWPAGLASNAVRRAALPEVAGRDIVILAVPASRLAEAAGAVAPHLRPGSLVLDVGSIKVGPVASLLGVVPRHADILVTHPLFGPQSAGDGLAGHKIVLCPVRGRRTVAVARFLRISLGLEVLVTTPDAHDRSLPPRRVDPSRGPPDLRHGAAADALDDAELRPPHRGGRDGGRGCAGAVRRDPARQSARGRCSQALLRRCSEARGRPVPDAGGWRLRVNSPFTMLGHGGAMVVRTRIRAIMVPLTLYLVSGAVSGYFLWTAKNGERGSKAKLEYKATIAELRNTLTDLQAQRAKWDHRVSLMRSESVDRDLAEEQVRDKLGYVDSRDVEIFTGTVKH